MAEQQNQGSGPNQATVATGEGAPPVEAASAVNVDNMFLEEPSGAAPAPVPEGADAGEVGAVAVGTGPTTQQVTDALEQARQLGVDVTHYKTGAELVQGMYEVVRQMQPFAQIGQQAAENWDDYQAWLEERQRQPTTAPSKPGDGKPATVATDEFDLDRHFGEAWGVPDWKPEWDAAVQAGRVVKGDDGQWEPASGHEFDAMPTAAQMNAHERIRAEALERLLVKGNPIRQLYDRLKPAFERSWGEAAQRAIEQHVSTLQQQGVMAQWDGWFEQYNGTEWGQNFIQEVRSLRQNGLNDPIRAYQIALRVVGGPPQQQQQSPGQQPAAQPPLGTAATSAALPGLPEGYQYTVRGPDGRVLSADEVSALKQKSFLAKASHTPSTANTPEQTQDLRPATEAELHNFFLEGAS